MMAKLDESLSFFKDSIQECIKSERAVCVLTHMDCDGITSGSIIAKALFREGARCTVRTSKEFNSSTVESLKNDPRDFYIITDLAGGFAKELDSKLGQNWIVLDHHQIAEEEHDNQRVINAWKYGIDGGTEVCAGGMAYLASSALDEKNSDLSAIAVVSALGDRQDRGQRKSFTGKNFEIASTAKEQGLVDIDLDLLLVGRETRAVSDALAFTSQPFIEGLTWNRDACLALLNSSGVQLKQGGRWRVPAELTEDEKRAVIESITKFASGKNATDIMEELIGYTYTFPREDTKSFLHDGREFSTMLNSCGRISKSGVGMAVCMGDRSKSLHEGEAILKEYRKIIRDLMNRISNERWRTSESGACIMINGDGIVPETMTGTISSLIAGSPKNSGKIVILRTGSEGNTVKFSSRKAFGCKSEINLSSLMKAGAEKFDGVGGGHDAAAGAKITKDKLDGFLDYLEANVVGMQGSNSAK